MKSLAEIRREKQQRTQAGDKRGSSIFLKSVIRIHFLYLIDTHWIFLVHQVSRVHLSALHTLLLTAAIYLIIIDFFLQDCNLKQKPQMASGQDNHGLNKSL